MTSKEIQQLISFISKSGLDEVKIETDEFKISVKKTAQPTPHFVAPVATSPVVQPGQGQAPVAQAPEIVETTQEQKQETIEAKAEDSSNLVEVKAPMIGTFYRAPNPESAPFVQVGDTIKAGDTVCIIEAMKLFNEIESEVSGKVVKVLADNASPVEYDQPLFLIEPA